MYASSGNSLAAVNWLLEESPICGNAKEMLLNIANPVSFRYLYISTTSLTKRYPIESIFCFYLGSNVGKNRDHELFI